MKKACLVISLVFGLTCLGYSQLKDTLMVNHIKVSNVVVKDSLGNSLISLFVQSVDTADINNFIAAKGSSLTPLLAAKYPFIADLMPIVMIFFFWFIRRLERSILKNKIHN